MQVYKQQIEHLKEKVHQLILTKKIIWCAFVSKLLGLKIK